MADFLLVHGTCHAAWCWHRVVPLLQAMGHSVQAIDLPGSGRNAAPPAAVTLAAYAHAITAALSRPTIVIGHSAGGYAITAAAEHQPRNIRALVYLCAYLPKDGLSLARMRKLWPEQPLAGAIRVDATRETFTFAEDRLDDLFYHDCDDDARALARTCLTPQVIAPQETPLAVTAATTTLPRHYIRCDRDRVIPPDYQTAMAEGLPPAAVSSLDASHSPFFSQPRAVAARLDAIAAGLD